ncbi:MAG: branched-chain amino acid ABC transporter permease [Alphaproteobacteria bacterium]|nr:branched-chain amino acid ABC transporter permease [Alphaproteobacteria bacterium]
MMLDIYLNQIVSGVLTGLVYGLSALGLSVIFGVCKIVNFAHGEMMVIGMYVALLLFRWLGLDPLISIPLVGSLLFVLGYALQARVINRLIDVPDHMQFLLLAAVAIIIVSGCLMIFGPDAQNVPLSYAYDSYELGPLLVDKVRVLAGGAAIAVAAALTAFFRWTRTGKAIRACADNLTGARVIGLDVKRLFALSFGLGAACIGAAGCILLMMVDVHPYLATEYTLLAFVIVIVGGLGSLAGALLAGVLIGVSEALAGLLIDPSLKSMFSFGLLILVLLFRPQGLLGKPAG